MVLYNGWSNYEEELNAQQQLLVIFLRFDLCLNFISHHCSNVTFNSFPSTNEASFSRLLLAVMREIYIF